MRTRLFFVLLLVAGGLVFVVPSPASACSCAPLPPFQRAVEEADAVFAGVVTSSEQTSGQSFPGSKPYGNFVYTFAVDEVVAGAVGATIEVASHSSGAACGIRFRERDRYIVFAYEDGRGFETNSCSRTERINETVDFGGKAPKGAPAASEADSSGAQDSNDGRPPQVLVGAAVVLGGAGVLLLLRFLLRVRR